MPTSKTHSFVTTGIALVWLANGLFCKVLNLVPRHTQIVARILGLADARPLAMAIGLAEIGMAAWVLSGRYRRWCGLAQIGLVGTMNALEFALAPDLLLWGRGNAAFAVLFMGLLYWHYFRPVAALAR